MEGRKERFEISKPSHLTTKKGKNANHKKKTSDDWISPITSHKKTKTPKKERGKITSVDPITIRVQTHSWSEPKREVEMEHVFVSSWRLSKAFQTPHSADRHTTWG